jgi:diguanylate cyclase (GGDEF)-like protein
MGKDQPLVGPSPRHPWLDLLPRGRGLPDEVWATRHRWVVRILVVQCLGIAVFALTRGNSVEHAVTEALAPGVLAALACAPRLGKTLRSALAAGGLMVISAALVHLSDGYIEAHFHFFVMIPIVALYEAWVPFAVAVGVVLVHHGVMGVTDPAMLYNHPAALAHPWVWAGIHTGAIGLACVGAVVNWKAQERLREGEADLTAQLVHLANHDPLTGLPSRALFMDRLNQALLAGSRTGATTSVLMLDMDGFKEVNDTFGHASGDVVLQEVARRLSSVVRAQDTVTRLGGDEYTVLLVATDAPSAEQTAERVAAALAAPYDLGGASVDLEVSIGVTTSSSDDDAFTLMRVADAAMYHAKEQRLGIVRFDDAHPLAAVSEHPGNRIDLLGDLRRALQEHEIVLHYQPKVDLATGAMVGVEALARWDHPRRGLLSPGDFIALVERTNLSHRLTEEVLDLALAQVRRWSDDGRDVPVSVNLSRRGLLDPGLVDLVTARLAEHDVGAHLLMLEITEMSVVSDPTLAMSTLHRLGALGVRLSLDDFGTGYSSLVFLTDLPIDELKVDRSFIQNLAADERDPVLMRAAVDLAHDLGLTVVAEGVEDEETRVRLSALGCDLAQGFFFARPVPAGELESWLADAPLLTRV